MGGFAESFGDRGDAIIELAILEHWRNVWLGASSWWQTFYFHPHSATLGYNDGYFVSGAIYALLRIAVDPFWAVLGTVAIFRSIAFWSCLWLLARFAGGRWELALTGAAIFTIGNTQYLQAIHGQFQVQALLPLLVGTGWQCIRSARAGDRRKASLFAALFSILLGAILWTSFYLGWFTLLFGLLLLAVAAIELLSLQPAEKHKLLRQFLLPILTAATVLTLAALPMLWLYLPKLEETGGHTAHAAQYYLLQLPDLISSGSGNWLWGGLQDWVWSVNPNPARNTDPEFLVGHPLFFLCLFAAALIATFQRRKPSVKRPDFALPLSVAILLSVFITLDLEKYSPWTVVDLIPGASGIRVIGRFILILVLPILILVVATLGPAIDRFWNRHSLVATILAVLFVIEQGNSADVTNLDRASLERLLASPRPPSDCKAFAVVAGRPNEGQFHSPRLDRLYPHNVDAMLLAEWWQRPTINGFSTFNPPGWNFADPRSATYRDRVLRYAHSSDIDSICFLDARQNPPWTR